MAALVLTVDCGNSRCKLRLWRAGGAADAGPVDAVELASDAALPEAARRWLAGRERAGRGGLVSVAPAALERALADALAEACDELALAPDPGLDVCVRVPAEVGRDRLFAARGALERLGRSAIVVDAGTALTVDAVRAEGGGAFLGGAIAPGPALLAESLGRGAARLFAVEPRPGARTLGRDTEEALLAGVVVGFRGAARALVDAVAAEAGLADAPVALTGGARGLLAGGALGAREVALFPDLVHHGLLAALDPRGPRTAGAP